MSSRITWVALAVGGCGLGAIGSGPSDAGSSDAGDAEAGDVPADAAAEVLTITDAPAPDAGPVDEAGCTTLVIDDFSSPDPRWVREGDAVFDGGAAVLVFPQQQHHGAVFMALPATTSPSPPTSFEASFTMIMNTDGGPMNPADGITLVWASDTAQPPIGGTGSQLGFCPDGNSMNVGPRGAALALHVSSPIGVSPRESDGGFCIVPSPLPFAFTNTQAVAVSVSGTNIDASVAGAPFGFEITKPVLIRWIGFTAATGGGVAQFSIDDVKIKLCP